MSPTTPGSANSGGPISILNWRACEPLSTAYLWCGLANTGISAVVDGKGRIVGQLDLKTQGVLDLPIPSYLGRTLYDLFGEFIFFISMLVIFVVVRFKEKNFLAKSKKPGLTIQLPIR